MKASHASWMLLAVTALWGLSFSWTYSWLQATRDSGQSQLLSSLTLIALRMPLALLLLSMWQPGLVRNPTRYDHLGGAFLGSVFCLGFILQTWGMTSTTPALSGFFTALCNAWAPLLAYLFYRQKVAPLTLLGLLVALIGCAVLVNGWEFGRGELLTIGASILFAFQMLILDRLGRTRNPSHLSAGFFLSTCLVALVFAVVLANFETGVADWLRWTWAMVGRGDLLLILLALAVFPSALAFHWMNTYQPQVPVSRAAVIYLLEPVFAAAVSLWIGHEELTQRLLFGGLLILLGNVLVELPRWLPRARRWESTTPREAA